MAHWTSIEDDRAAYERERNRKAEREHKQRIRLACLSGRWIDLEENDKEFSPSRPLQAYA